MPGPLREFYAYHDFKTAASVPMPGDSVDCPVCGIRCIVAEVSVEVPANAISYIAIRRVAVPLHKEPLVLPGVYDTRPLLDGLRRAERICRGR